MIEETPISESRIKTLCTFTGQNNNTMYSNGTIYIYNCPTQNCQINSVGAFNSLLSNLVLNPSIQSQPQTLKDGTLNTEYYYDDKSAKVKYCTKSFFKIMKAATSLAINRHMFLLDLNNYKKHTVFIDEAFKDNIVLKQEYTSTNGSKMILYLVKTQFIKDKNTD